MPNGTREGGSLGEDRHSQGHLMVQQVAGPHRSVTRGNRPVSHRCELRPLLILLGKVARRLLSKFYEWFQRGRSRDVQVVRIRQLA
jgi:hypothetical protein